MLFSSNAPLKHKASTYLQSDQHPSTFNTPSSRLLSPAGIVTVPRDLSQLSMHLIVLLIPDMQCAMSDIIHDGRDENVHCVLLTNSVIMKRLKFHRSFCPNRGDHHQKIDISNQECKLITPLRHYAITSLSHYVTQHVHGDAVNTCTAFVSVAIYFRQLSIFPLDMVFVLVPLTSAGTLVAWRLSA